MKKMIAILLIGTILIAGGCSRTKLAVPEQGYTILEADGYDGFVTSAKHTTEINLSRKRTVDVKGNKEKEINYRGSNYQVTYEETVQDAYYNQKVELYAKRDGLNCVEFGVNTKTGRLDSYSWYDETYLNNPNLEKKSREECLGVAREYLALYIDDPEQYELTGEKYVETPEYEADYEFCFVRMIDGVRTADLARIRVTVHGIVTYHGFVCLGEMKGAQLPDEEKMIAIQEDIKKKLDGIYEMVKEKYDVSYELDKMEFVRLQDGRYALDFHYTVNVCSLINEEVLPMQDYTRLIAILEDA